MGDWYVVRTKPRRETAAETHLLRQGFEVYLPRLARKKQRRGSWRTSIEALFPRYLFLRCRGAQQSLGPVRSTLGVSEIVCFGRSYARIPVQAIRLLRAREDRASGMHLAAPTPPPASGDKVRISEGPFAGLAGVFSCASGDHRVVILLNLLGRDTRVVVPTSSMIQCAAT